MRITRLKNAFFFHCGFADDRKATLNDCMAFGCNKEQCTKVARLLTGAYKRQPSGNYIAINVQRLMHCFELSALQTLKQHYDLLKYK